MLLQLSIPSPSARGSLGICPGCGTLTTDGPCHNPKCPHCAAVAPAQDLHSPEALYGVLNPGEHHMQARCRVDIGDLLFTHVSRKVGAGLCSAAGSAPLGLRWLLSLGQCSPVVWLVGGPQVSPLVISYLLHMSATWIPC